MWEGEWKRCSSGGVSGDQEWDAHSRRSLVSLSSQMIHAIRVLFFRIQHLLNVSQRSACKLVGTLCYMNRMTLCSMIRNACSICFA